MNRIDYRAVGLKVGLEIHQQLATSHKLFCECPAELSEEEHDVFIRRLRPTRSELGDVDPAALFEWRRGRYYEYQAPVNHSCLVEADEEPPHPLNREALAIAVAIGKSLGSTIVDEIHVMRKIVIDGSNTSGFQRTAIVALGGELIVDGKRVPIETIVVEEDASRKIGEKGNKVIYRLDRLGIPLIEIATAPVIESPEEAKNVALAIGRLLRFTGRVKRGLGTIRQDLNVSIRGGAKTEIKGVQRLDLIPKVVEYEVLRQLRLLEIRDEIKRRGVSKNDIIASDIKEVTDLLTHSKSKLVKRVLSKGGKALALLLPKMKGLIGYELVPGRRFGTELADYARFWAGVSGLLHSDELPGYGITEEEVTKIYSVLGGNPESDAFVLVLDEPKKASKALEVVKERVMLALDGVPEETRAALEDGTTRYMRPRPGKARMYPETDIPPMPVSDDVIKDAEKIVPEPYEVKLKKLVEGYSLSRDLAEAVLDSEYLPLIEELLSTLSDRLPPSFIASSIVVRLKGLQGDGVPVENISDAKLREVLTLIAEGKVAKEAFDDIVKFLAENPGYSVEAAVKKLGLERLSIEEIERIVNEVINAHIEDVMKRGERATGLIMGRVMSLVRGKADGRIVADIVRRKLGEITSSGTK